MKQTTKSKPSTKKSTAKAKPAQPAPPKVSRTHRPDGMALEEWQLQLRKQFAEKQDFRLENVGDHPLFSEFRLTNPSSGKTYRIAIRGGKPGENYCSCPDYKINNLGTCKHIEFTLASLLKKRGAKKALQEGYAPPFSEIYLRYGLKREVCFKRGNNAPKQLLSLAKRYFDERGVLREERLLDFSRIIPGMTGVAGHEVRCYDDVMEFIAAHQDAAHRRDVVTERLAGGIDSPLFDAILETQLFPYQREGALFAVQAGRSLIGDDMGLGKTVQALAAAELMAELFGIRKVLIVSPTSLKHQWQGEIERFTSRSSQVIEGMNQQRGALYANESFYKLVNYELVARDLRQISEWGPDLIILDEAQRIKNWQTRTARTVKGLESTFAIVLTGTPIENRIEELHSIMEFVDRHHLGPLYRFAHNHRITDGSGKLVGYRNLDAVRSALKSVMIRRKKGEVLKQLPARLDKNFMVPMTPEQREIHDENGEIVAKLVAKWRRCRFLCEADQRRMLIALANMRMAADNTWLVDKKTKHGPKVEELETLLRELVLEGGEKVVIFSQWLRMNELVEDVLSRNGIGYVHLNGSVPSRDRKGLMTRFREEPECMVFLSTDAGGVGLNLQSGSVVINMDIPWNPAILEQRIARVHRMGQKRNVRIVNFVTRGSIEERILDLLRFKKSLFAGALDSGGEDVVMIGQSQLEQFMESVESATEGLKPVDAATEQEERREEAEAIRAGEEVVADGEPAAPEAGTGAAAGAALPPLGELLQNGARFLMDLGRALSPPQAQAGAGTESRAGSGESRNISLERFITTDEATGKPCLKIPMPEPEVVASIVSGLGQLLTGLMEGRK